MDNKKELLKIAEVIAKDINNQGCGNYVPKIINSIKIAKRYDDRSKFEFVLKEMKKISFGGKSETFGFFDFVDTLSKKREYRLAEFNLDELEYVFSWVRRLVNKEIKQRPNFNGNYRYNKGSNNYTKSSNKNDNYNKQKDRRNSNHGYNESLNNNPFAEALKGLK